MRSHLAAACFLLSSSVGLAAPNTPHWIELRSQHFLVVTDSTEKDARHIASQFERMRAVFHVLFPTITADTGQTTILALKDKKGFQSLEPADYLAKGQIEPAGLFLRTPDTNYLLLRLDVGNGQDHPYATVYHEYTHLLTSKSEWLPLWINEGLAEFYQNIDIGNKVVSLGQPSDDDVRSLSDDEARYLRHRVRIPLTTLLAVDHNSPNDHDEKKGSVFYAESWALTHFLIVNDHNEKTHLLDDYFTNLAKGQDSITAAQNAFGDIQKLEDRLDFYIREHLDFFNPQYKFSYFQLPMAFPVDELTFKIQPISNDDANAIRADVLVYDHRKDEALALLNDTLRDDPKNALAHETMGLLKLRDGDLAAARTWYDQAVQLDSQSYLAQYYSAALALRAGDTSNSTAIETRLLASIHLNPTFAPAYDALAQFYSTYPDKLTEAHKMNVQAIELDPSNVTFRLHAAFVLMLQQQPDDAIRLLKEAERVAATPADLAKVRSRREQIERTQATIAKFKAEHPNGEAIIRANGEITFNTPADPAAGRTQSGIEAAPENPHFPTAAPTGPQHVATGIVRNVNCSYPSILSLDLESQGKSATYYTNDYLKVDYYNMNFVPAGSLNPCKDIEGMKASIHFTDVHGTQASDKPEAKLPAGQIVKIALTKLP